MSFHICGGAKYSLATMVGRHRSGEFAKRPRKRVRFANALSSAWNWWTDHDVTATTCFTVSADLGARIVATTALDLIIFVNGFSVTLRAAACRGRLALRITREAAIGAAQIVLQAVMPWGHDRSGLCRRACHRDKCKHRKCHCRGHRHLVKRFHDLSINNAVEHGDGGRRRDIDYKNI